MENVEQIIRNIISETTINPDLILTPDTNLITDLGMTSITLITMVVEIEQRLNIELPDDFLTVDNLSKFSNVTNMINNIIKQNVARAT